MQYCNHCKVYIKENRNKCTLCGNALSVEDTQNGDKMTFPKIPPFYHSHLAMKIMIFISIAAVVLSFSINAMFPTTINWPLFLLFGLISMWLCLIVIIQKRYHIPKKIIWQVVIISVLSLFWDWRTGWRGWSLDFVIPIACMSAMLLMYVTAKVLRLSVNDYVTYALIDGVFGIIPLLFIIFDWVNIIYPSVISVALSIITLAAIFIFQGDNIKQELNKRMHI
ncbi:DUF6320 domain-containing protein [Tissierella sp. Yu-01]|uniref:DUF6320 domain-containing protein n=2 Tax=Tissierella sp. Yu-01 TaxID=3035694 RepID=UPI00240D070C|nr:DUF6320 domain-containing protein [Tissierella sp. Yu-01]WFA08996.1 DUF6320 domain-containing protein [Tissierella sp. Yu-01]